MVTPIIPVNDHILTIYMLGVIHCEYVMNVAKITHIVLPSCEDGVLRFDTL